MFLDIYVLQNTLCPKKNIPDIFDCNLKHIIRFR